MGAAMAQALRNPEQTFTIRQLCREFDVTPRALRFYEDKGLLSPQRVGQARVYRHRDRVRLQYVLRGRRVGFSLDEIRELLDLYDRRDGGATQLAESLSRCRTRILELKRQREDIEGAIGQLEGDCAWMEQRLSEIRPDLLPQAQDYEAVLRARLDSHDAVTGEG